MYLQLGVEFDLPLRMASQATMASLASLACGPIQVKRNYFSRLFRL